MQQLIVLDIDLRTLLADILLLPHHSGALHSTVLQDHKDKLIIKEFIINDLVLVLTWDTARSVAFKGTWQNDAPHSGLSLKRQLFPRATTVPTLGSHKFILQLAMNPALLPVM
jgi:hypothetical protein